MDLNLLAPLVGRSLQSHAIKKLAFVQPVKLYFKLSGEINVP